MEVSNVVVTWNIDFDKTGWWVNYDCVYGRKSIPLPGTTINDSSSFLCWAALNRLRELGYILQDKEGIKVNVKS